MFGLIPENLWTLFWIGAFGSAGLLFLVGLWLNRENWWMAIPGFILLGLSATILADNFFPGSSFSGSIFLGGVALAFITVYLMNREYWWAIIPGGINLTLAVVAGLDDVSGWETGGIFFLGLALTFAVVAVTPTTRGKMGWAWIPAGVMFALAVMTMASLEGIFSIVWPLVLVAVGGGLLYRNYLRTRSE